MDEKCSQRRTITTQSYGDRVCNHDNEIARRLLILMEKKESNLCVSVDVLTKSSFLRIVEAVADHVCIIKTHIDIIEDFDQDLVDRLVGLSKKKDFIIFEDRKFADIEWSHLTNAHTVPGEGVITGLAEVGVPKSRGLLLLAEMSSRGTLAKGDYTVETVQMARRHKDFVIGFISQRRLEYVGSDPESDLERAKGNTNELQEDFLILSPGVGLDNAQDKLGQNYRTPHQVIYESGADVMIVGRGIYGQENKSGDSNDSIVAQAIRYKQAGWKAYVERQLASP